MRKQKDPAFLQGADNLRVAAAMAASAVGPAKSPAAPARGSLAVAAKAMEANARRTPPAHTCQQRLKLSFYFDGTGNNRDADLPTFEHSNVARMYRAALDDSDTDGIYSFYIPGLGTYFREVKDPGESLGKAFARRGEDRLQWALKKFDERRRAARNLVGIDLAIFGFSRGAALAKAFANRVQGICEPAKGGVGWVLKGSSVAVEVYFLGLWDTVASAGLPKSFNNQSLAGLIRGAIGGTALPPDWRMSERDVSDIAYGDPGADPSPSNLWAWADGHLDWASEIAIPAIVTKGVHMMAGHEIRNSFPVDTVLHGSYRPASFEGDEFVYPGSHSDVGGGYRPGEGARSPRPGQQLALITLRVMYDKARAAGVPLFNLSDRSVISAFRLDFALALPSDPEINQTAARDYAELLRLWNRYLDHCGRSSKSLGQWFLAHMKAYYAWRFQHIRTSKVDRASGQPTGDERAVEPLERSVQREEAELDRRIAAEERSPELEQARRDTAAARLRLERSQESQARARYADMATVLPTPAQAQQLAEEQRKRDAALERAVVAARQQRDAAEQAQSLAEDPLRKLEAQKATLPSRGTLERNWRQYDERLYRDAQGLCDAKLIKRLLRPHYKALVDAWEDEFLHHKGLVDADLIRFFDTCVHDSLADFAMDATLPSDPRVVYVGGDEIELFAMRGSEPAHATASHAA